MSSCCGQESYAINQRPTTDSRLQLIDEIKKFLQDTENSERSSTAGSGSRRQGVCGVRDMEEECRRYRKRRECSPPIITSLGAHEIRPTSTYDAMKFSNTKQVTYVDATRSDPFDPMPPAPWELPRTPSQELRASNLYTSCACRKRNGLQQDCERWECGGRPECVAANPGPCCVPSKTRKPVRGDRRYRRGVSDAGDSGTQYKRGQNGFSGPGSKEPSVMCVCEPIGIGQASRPQQQAATSMGGQFHQGSNQGVPQGQKKADVLCLCQPTSQQAPHHQPPLEPRPQQQYHQPQTSGGQFVAVAPAGAKYVCCSL